VSNTVAIVLFPAVTQLDLTGPYEVFNRMPSTKVVMLSSSLAPVRTEWGLTLMPDATFESSPDFDVVCVPGGWGVNEALESRELIEFLRNRTGQARYITSVCSGALLLGAAGLLEGYRATTHWMSHELLSLFGAIPVHERVVIDRNRITGGGVTAGIDLALVIAAEMFGDSVAQEIQLAIEYDPAPPFESGSPLTAPAEVRNLVLTRSAAALTKRQTIVERVVRREQRGAH
jgi:cyclohexyl-isocyanide hydratase